MKKHWMVFAIALVMALGTAGALAQGYAYGDTADEVAAIQEALEELDLYYADITGHYGRKTERAVMLFQRKYRLPQTGVVDETTLAQLYLVTGQSVPEKASGTLSASLVLRHGSTGEAVRILQENLTVLGFYKGEITGRYGNLTKEAVRLFQRKNGLSSDGVAGPKTLAEIEHELSGEIGDKAESGAADPAAAAGVSSSAESTPGTTIQTPAAAATVSLGDVTLLSTERVLRRTSSSGYVTRLQNALNALGYFPQSATGYFGSVTEEAVKAYQTAKGLTADGIAGRATLTAINKDLKEKLSGAVD